MDSVNSQANIYPVLKVELIKNPKKLYAIPLIGMVIKGFMLIPVYIVFIALMIAAFVLVIGNAFVVLSTGKYWKTAYDLVLGIMRYQTKITFFTYGMTDKYPGFNLAIQDNFSVDMPMPTAPGRLYAIPLIGILIRGVLLIPFSIFTTIIERAATLSIYLGASVIVLLQGQYPEIAFELGRDSVRLSLSQMAYGVGLSDKYPSFNISWNHKNLKIALVIVSALLLIAQFTSNMSNRTNQSKTNSKIPAGYSNYSNTTPYYPQ